VATTAAPAKRTMLDRIESLGNKVPHHAIIFLGLCVLVIVLSALLAAFDVKVTYEVAEPPSVTATQDYETGSSVADYQLPPPGYAQQAAPVIKQETTEIKSLLSVDGVRFLFTSSVSSFSGFSVVAVILVAILGVGVAEEAGLMGALIRKLVKVAPPWPISWIVVFIGAISSIASEAGYLIRDLGRDGRRAGAGEHRPAVAAHRVRDRHRDPGHHHPGAVAKWAIFAPVFIPLFIRLGVAPQTLVAAYRIGYSPMNVITPLMVYLPFIVLVAQRYKKPPASARSSR
jgi:p-aminobenzoyl-glutamate transporter AbgT